MTNPPPRPTKRNPLLELTRFRLRTFTRNPGVIFWVFVFPLLLAVALGIAFREQPPTMPRIAIVGAAGPAVEARLKEIKAPLIRPSVDDPVTALQRGELDLILDVNRLPTNNQAPGTRVVYRYDPTRPESQSARLAVDAALQGGFGRQDVFTVTDQAITEIGGRYIDFLIPGLLGMNIMSSCMWGIGYAVVDTRRRRLLKRFAATPMNRAHFLISFVLSRLVFLVAEVILLILFGAFIFDVTVRGSVLAVGVVTLLGAFAFSGMALVIAARATRTEIASGWINFAMLPMWLLSGSFFSYSRFPESLHPLIQVLPLTALNDSLRAIINDGAGLLSTWTALGTLLAWGGGGFLISLIIFKWR